MTFRLKPFLLKLNERTFQDDVFSSTAQVAFYFSFAIFPLLLFLVSLFGLFMDASDTYRENLFFYLRQIMPPSAFQLVKNTIQEVTASSSSGKLTLGLLIALWSASTGMDSLRISLNRVYKCKETRDWWKTKLVSIVLTIILTLLITLSLSIIFYGWQMISFSLSAVNLPNPPPFIPVALQWIIIFAVLILIFELFYNILPNRKLLKWHWITPGASIGIVLWLLLSIGLRTYLQYFNAYDRMYGSIGAVIILMLWLYLTALVILIGGMINAVSNELKESRAFSKSAADNVEAVE